MSGPEHPEAWSESAPYVPRAESMIDFAITVGDTLPNIHTDAALAQRLGMADAVVDGRMLALVATAQVRECIRRAGGQADVVGVELRFRSPVHPGNAVVTEVVLPSLLDAGRHNAQMRVVKSDGFVAVTGHAVVHVKGDTDARTEI